MSPPVSDIITQTTLNPKDNLAFIKELPTFDSNPGQLQNFIKDVEEIIALINSTSKLHIAFYIELFEIKSLVKQMTL